MCLACFSLYSQAQNFGTYYKVNDYCFSYTENACQSIVTKCRDRGGDFCSVYEQIPCEEACQWHLSD